MEPESPSHIFVQNWLRFHSTHQNQNYHNGSCNLTTNDPPPTGNPDHDFDFGGSRENKMCSADNVFFQGQILPITPIMGCCFGNTGTTKSHINNHDHHHDSGGTTTRSHIDNHDHHLDSGNNDSTTSGSGHVKSKRNHFFYSQPSIKLFMQNPRPTIHHPPKTSSKWNFLHLGPVAPQEIRLAHIKNRNNVNIKDHNKNIDNTTAQKKKKIKIKMPSFGRCNCKCSADKDVIETALCPPP